MPARLAILFFIAPCHAFDSSRGIIDSKKAKTLVNSVFSEENKTKLHEVEKNRLNGTDEIVFLKQYHSADSQEVKDAGLVAEKYNEVPFDALIGMLKAASEGRQVPVPAVVQAAVASKPKARKHRLHPRLRRGQDVPDKTLPEPAHVANGPKTFIDLGSGVGRAVLFACATGEFETCEGVELSETRHKMAVDALAKFKHLAPGAAKKVTLINGNLLDNDAYFKKDVMLLDNDFLSEGVMENFVRKFEDASPPGTVLLTTKKIPELSARAATRTRMAVEGEKGHRELFYKYVRT